MAILLGEQVHLGLFEHDKTYCTVFLGEKQICKLKSYKDCGDYFYETTSGDIDIDLNIDKKILTIKNKNKKIASITFRLFLKARKARYIIEYDNESDEDIIALIFLGLLSIDFNFPADET